MMSKQHAQLMGLVLTWVILVPGTAVFAQQDDQSVKQPEPAANARLNWHQQHMQMQADSPTKEYFWQHIGPTHMSGRITDIAKPLDQPYTFYVTSASGGVWKTENEGTSWTPIFDDAPSAAWGAVAVDPNNSNTVWIGGGESNIFRSSMAGTGIYRSDDAGKTWQHMGLADTQHIARIVVHPQDSNTVYVAAGGHEYTPNLERGVFKSTDGGKTWNKVLYESDMVGANDVLIDPQNPDNLYASMWYRIRRPWSDPVPGPGGGIYFSRDGGESWTRAHEGLPQRDLTGRIGISLAASQPNVLYALIDNHEIARKAKEGERDSYGRLKKDVIKGAEVYRSNDSGKSWAKVSKSSPIMERLFSTYGWVFSQVRVDPNDPETSYIMGVPLLKSTNGGVDYQPLFDRGLHGDHHAMWIDPNNSNYVINGNDGGVNISYDGGQSWKNIENLPVVQFYNVELDNEEPFNVYGSIQDNNSWVGPSNHRPGRSNPYDWKRAPGGEASYHAIDPEDPDTLYSESFYGSINRTDLATGQTQSIKPQPAEGEPPLRGQWLAPFQLSPHNSRVVYHGMQYLYRSLNRGDTWERISPDLTDYDEQRQGNISFATISSISESPSEFGVIYVGTDDGRLHVTKNSGDDWSEIKTGLPDKWVSRVTASRYQPGRVYLTMNGKRDNDFQIYVYVSEDYGQTWQDISHGIPGGPANVILEHPEQEDTIYVGTDMGVYVSTDRGQSWNVLGSRLPITFVHDIKIHPRDKVMVIGTHGRGVWKLDLENKSTDRPDRRRRGGR